VHETLLTSISAIAPSSAPSLKRHHASLDLSDSENVDPSDFKASASKRKKLDTDDGLCKPSNSTLRTFSKPKSRISSSSILTPRPQTPTITTTVKPSITSSAPATADRSPTKPKRSGILSNRRTRLNAPTFGLRNKAPLSLAAALSGTLANKKHKQRLDGATLEESKPKAWFFDIFEETEEQQNLVANEWTMTQSACTLDISDDESKTSTGDDRGKENIPPNELYTPAATVSPLPAAVITTQIATTSRKDLMTDEPRTPLGDLNPSDYYADGHDATSVVLVPEEEEDMPEEQSEQTACNDDLLPPTTTAFNFTAETPAPSAQDQLMIFHSELSCLLLGAAATLPLPLADDDQRGGLEMGFFDTYTCAGEGVAVDGEGAAEKAEIEIWESGSAKDEGEMEGGIFVEL